MNGSRPLAPVRGRLALAGALALAFSQGCASLAERDAGSEDTARIAQNLVYTLTQLPEVNPLTTTVQISDPKTEFGQEVVRLIREVGYGIQPVPDDRGGNYLRYRVSNTASELGTETRYGISIGDVSVERGFAQRDDRLVPVTAQRVDGSEQTYVTLDDALFDAQIGATASQVVFDDELEPSFADAAGNAIPVTPTPAPGLSNDDFGARVKQNLYNANVASNFVDVFAGYEDVQSATLGFPNDSLRLGERQKAIIERYAAELRPGTDLLSVVGCSHGPTAIANGNTVLALGRANRVKEALAYAGVPPAVVLDEGCWAGTEHEYFPDRGVVLTLKRRPG